MSDDFDWPKIPIVGVKNDAPKFKTEVWDLTDDELRKKILDFYCQFMVPQLVCAGDNHPPCPNDAWLLSKDPERTAIVCAVDDEIHGVWIIKGNSIQYACSRTEFIANIYRALWDESIKHFDYIWASTQNPVIMAFAQKAVRNPPMKSSPVLNGDRLEWRRK